MELGMDWEFIIGFVNVIVIRDFDKSSFSVKGENFV